MKHSQRDVRVVREDEAVKHRSVSETPLWQCVCESFMAGVFHSIGSRVSALSGIATMARMGRELDGMLLSLLEDEVEHLTDLLEASRILPRGSAAASGPSQVAILAPRVLQLLELTLEARGVEIDYEGPEEGANVAADPITVTHSMAALLSCLCWRRRGAEELRVRLSAEGDQVEFRASLVEAPAEGEPVPGDRPTAGVPSARVMREGLETIAAAAAAAGGSLEIDDATWPATFVHRLPRLERD